MAIDNLNYAEQIAAYLRSDPQFAPDGTDLSAETPLLGTLVGSAPAPGEQDARSYSGLASGGIYTRTPKPWDPDDNRGVTPIAFSAVSGAIKPTITVRLESISRHFQFRTIKKSIVASVVVWMYAASHDSGKNALELIRRRLDLLLEDYIFTTDQGPVAQIEWNFNFGVQDNHRQFAGSLVDFTRFDIVTLRSMET